MLENNKASAYGDRKYGIINIKQGSQVCLYHVGVGVIAIGTATGDSMTCPYDGEPDGEYYVPCRFEFKVDPIAEPEKVVTASEINQQFGTGYKFRQTVFALPGEFADFIRKRLQEKTKKQR